ncbi:hypothetical protein M8818_005752 [Zalaria obscura]|uniref:Uncharacterized protein n=1 Tax=Zalaria obscura TaxID=2024903 RepID=A0ACC3SC16_9PEZI
MITTIPLFIVGIFLASHLPFVHGTINRQRIVRQFSPHRNASSSTTPMQVGNGNFAFGADVTGLQTFLPYNILSSWAWHNSSLPTTPGQTSPADFTGLDWWTHGRLVPYDQPNPAEADISQWLIANPQRINLGRVGLWFGGRNISESDLSGVSQDLDMYTGTMRSTFTLDGSSISVEVVADPDTSTIAVQLQSDLLNSGHLGVFFDYPYMTGVNKFEAPFVGVWNATANHTTSVQASGQKAQIQHDEDTATYFTMIQWNDQASISGPLSGSHRYILQPKGCTEFSFTVTYSQSPVFEEDMDFSSLSASSSDWWKHYWESGSFIDLTQTAGAASANATELQRRIIQSQYLLAVNEAGHDPPQESGLTNNGWYGKFHAEMFVWHLGHWGRWSKWYLLERAIPGVYERFLPSSIQRAQQQGYAGARWGKQSDPTGRSAPGAINSLLIWQQPHVFQFAEYEWRAFPTNATLQKWERLLVESADFMASYAFWNESTGVYDLGPPMYPVSENTDPNATINPTFELAYWRFGLNIASHWQRRLHKPIPPSWTHVAENLAPLPVENNTYVIYDGIPNMWHNSTYDEDHPSMLGIYGWLPPPAPPTFNLTLMSNTVAAVYATWNFTYSYGWDFPLLAMNAARMGDAQQAVDFLLHPAFAFDEAGYPVGGSRVPTPYFPGSSSLLFAVAMMAGGWTGTEGVQFPEGWTVEAEGFTPAL